MPLFVDVVIAQGREDDAGEKLEHDDDPDAHQHALRHLFEHVRFNHLEEDGVKDEHDDGEDDGGPEHPFLDVS